jgi:hypothetical protein
VDVLFHPRAAEDAATIETWWRANRTSAPELFVRELETTLALVASSPTLGALPASTPSQGCAACSCEERGTISTTDSRARRSRCSRFGIPHGAKVRRFRSPSATIRAGSGRPSVPPTSPNKGRRVARRVRALYGSTALRLYGSTALRLYGSTALRLYGSTTLRLYGSTALRLYGSTALRLYGSTVRRPHRSQASPAWTSSQLRICTYRNRAACRSAGRTSD